MNTLALVPATPLDVLVNASAIAERDTAVAAAKEIAAVADELDQDIAVGALKTLRTLEKDVETSRKTVKAPVLDLERKIDGLAANFLSPVESEVRRLTKLLSDYQAEQRRKAEEAERARQAELRRIAEEQRKREEELRKQAEERAKADEEARQKAEAEFLSAPDDTAAKADAEAAARRAEEQRRIEEEGKRKAAEAEAQRLQLAASRTVAPVKSAGMTVRAPWKFEVLDSVAVYRAHPELVKLEVSTSAVNEALRKGMRECPGLRIFQEVQAGVRV